jgi:hypothetical protein
MEAVKPMFALRTQGKPARARVFAPVLNPAGAPIPTANSPTGRCALGGTPQTP